MNKHRKSLVAANWKMNVLPSEAFQLAEMVKINTHDLELEVVIAPPYTHLALMTHLSSGNFSLGAQNAHYDGSGAYTGSISIAMLKDLKVEYIILGHSERREAYQMENDLLPKKIEACLRSNIKIIYCCGEPKEQRENKYEKEYVKNQLDHSFNFITEWDSKKIIIAYEPIWAIGTGLTASSDQADEMHKFIRDWIADKYGIEQAEQTKILYGGSVKSSNASDLASKENIDGALVGGASLNAEEFSKIVKAFVK